MDVTHGPTWKPDSRDDQKIPYKEADIGMPEWGIRHSTTPAESATKWLPTIYRGVASPPFHGTALAALLMEGAKELWNHDAYFDYTDRYMAFTAPGGEYAGLVVLWATFTEHMWDAYRAQCGPVWPETGNVQRPRLVADRRQAGHRGPDPDLHGQRPIGSDALTYSATGLPSGATFADQTFTWTPASAGRDLPGDVHRQRRLGPGFRDDHDHRGKAQRRADPGQSSATRPPMRTRP